MGFDIITNPNVERELLTAKLSQNIGRGPIHGSLGPALHFEALRHVPSARAALILESSCLAFSITVSAEFMTSLQLMFTLCSI
ncbi:MULTISPECIES: hypothetical protein [Rhizobium/Agrobacterium group]|uniref:Uncharacterized protein n=1 Tax=Agrobacterium vitis TaxID=373 RepID=A0ABW9TMW2_AGRVI|nr:MULTISPECIES: hypothetical protein [Rhizobium/Agrobacterium group]MCF1450583.1 hypothetical protein [Allorhizobium ampelinum]MCF1463506.1 hypothetical protein [Allorhizobium ampelinum]MCF1470748.1 hypothetical protein [Allorhizobium ampelinum]MCF1496462.1 hypothetical protein [Allorhizobium ampelinum]MUO30657.1 hypothetical protein [Agrobacterium vitis]